MSIRDSHFAINIIMPNRTFLYFFIWWEDKWSFCSPTFKLVSGQYLRLDNGYRTISSTEIRCNWNRMFCENYIKIENGRNEIKRNELTEMENQPDSTQCLFRAIKTFLNTMISNSTKGMKKKKGGRSQKKIKNKIRLASISHFEF